MKKLFVFLFIISPLLGQTTFGRLFDISSKISVIKTENFDIIYDEDSEESAYYLTSFADETYTNIKSLLPTLWRRRVPVVITSDIHSANGYSSPMPYSSMVLIDYPMRVSFNYDDWMKALFLHEETHTISMSMTEGITYFLANVFGTYMAPNIFLPMFMLEGVTVSFESLEGEGRVNSPDALADIIQDLIEDRFKSLSQITGPYSKYPFGNIFYYYGGFFNSYLQKKYSMEKYGELWREASELPHLINLPLAFKKVYKHSIYKEYKAFEKEIKNKYLSESIETNTLSLTKYAYINTPRLYKGKIYYSDYFRKAVMVYDIKTGERQVFTRKTIGDIAIDNEEGLILITTEYQDANNVTKQKTFYFDSQNGKLIRGREITNMLSVCAVKDGVYAINPRGFQTDIVFIAKQGVMKTLLKGTRRVYFDEVAALSDNEIVFIMSIEGKRAIANYNKTDETIRLYNIEGVDYMQDLAVYNSNIHFSFSTGHLYKRAVIKADKCFIQTNIISGGVYRPMESEDGTLYYLARFSRGERLMEYPSSFPLMQTPMFLEEFTYEEDKITSSIIFDTKKYNSLYYLLPRMWFPTPGRVLSSWGVGTVGVDPLQENSYTLSLTTDIFAPMLEVNLDYRNMSTPVGINISFYDVIDFLDNTSPFKTRNTGGAFSVDKSFSFPLSPASLSLSSSVGYTAMAISDLVYVNLEEVSTNNQSYFVDMDIYYYTQTPYEWAYSKDRLNYSVSVRFSSMRGEYNPYINRGGFIGLYYDGYTSFMSGDSANQLEAILGGYIPYTPLQLNAYFAISDESVLMVNGSYMLVSRRPVFSEYSLNLGGKRYDLYFGFNASTLVFEIPIERGIGIFPMYLESISCNGGYKAAMFFNNGFSKPIYYNESLTVTNEVLYLNSLYASLSINFLLAYGILPASLDFSFTWALNTAEGSWNVIFSTPYLSF